MASHSTYHSTCETALTKSTFEKREYCLLLEPQAQAHSCFALHSRYGYFDDTGCEEEWKEGAKAQIKITIKLNPSVFP